MAPAPAPLTAPANRDVDKVLATKDISIAQADKAYLVGVGPQFVPRSKDSLGKMLDLRRAVAYCVLLFRKSMASRRCWAV